MPSGPTSPNRPRRRAGWAAVASGASGLTAFGFLFAGLMTRPARGVTTFSDAMFTAHDIVAVFQFLLMLPVVMALYELSPRRQSAFTKIAAGAVCFTVLFLLLGLARVLAAVLFMVPQGVFGLGLVVACWNVRDSFSRPLGWFGMIVGIGLILVALFPIGYVVFVDRIMLRIPAPDPASIPDHRSLANLIVHILLICGTGIGVVPLPIWTILVGRRLLAIGRPDSSVSLSP